VVRLQDKANKGTEPQGGTGITHPFLCGIPSFILLQSAPPQSSHLQRHSIQRIPSKPSLSGPKACRGAQMQNAVSETRGDHALTSMVENWRSRLEQRKQGKKPRFHQHLITPNPRKQTSGFTEWGKLREEDVRFVIMTTTAKTPGVGGQRIRTCMCNLCPSASSLLWAAGVYRGYAESVSYCRSNCCMGGWLHYSSYLDPTSTAGPLFSNLSFRYS